jgi:soluble lytic murein transglycosylase
MNAGMTRLALLLVLAFSLSGVGAAPVRAQDIAALMRGGNWPMAYEAATRLPDPVARKVVLFERLTAPRSATATEIAAFMAANPDWPLTSLLARRRDEALFAEDNDATALVLCDHAHPAVSLSEALLRCGDAYAHAGRTDDATSAIRAAWIGGPTDVVTSGPAVVAWETWMMQHDAGAIRTQDQWLRFERLAWIDAASAKRQAARLDASDKPKAEAWLALKRDDASALALAAALPAPDRLEPGLFLEQTRWLRRTGQDGDALSLWKASGDDVEKAASADHLREFWNERNLLARRILRMGDAAGAYALVDGHGAGNKETVGDAEFLAGFLALRRLNDPSSAARHFTTLANLSKAAITLARAHYWLGRTALARAEMATANDEFRSAAAFPTTFYGQLAALALGEDSAKLLARVRAAHDPETTPEQALALAGHELARAAGYLEIWGNRQRAQTFLTHLQDVLPDPADQVLLARFLTGMNMPGLAVSIARRAGQDGVVMPDMGWPMPVDVPQDSGIDPALALAVIRQESAFDTGAVSLAGARGLMQLMPATAAQIARQSGTPMQASTLPQTLTSDPGLNMRLGTAYLRKLLDQFGGAVPLAVAAYNAGPNRVLDWVNTNGDPRSGTDVIDWIELIPFNETRNYVQRVIESQVIYRARRGENGGSVTGHPLAPFLAKT